ncbi:MAG: hypothetical protein VX028_04370 [Nanoarchaeota archaeon]|nr:hypothetical protein [Nanoarchaeota archaeon]
MKKLLFFIVLVVLLFSACMTQDNISNEITNSNTSSNVVTIDSHIKVATFTKLIDLSYWSGRICYFS